jgi:hypothetical protein
MKRPVTDYPGFVIWRDQEPAELLMALGLLLFTLSVRRRQKFGVRKSEFEDRET